MAEYMQTRHKDMLFCLYEMDIDQMTLTDEFDLDIPQDVSAYQK